jgi:hypothetical protein
LLACFNKLSTASFTTNHHDHHRTSPPHKMAQTDLDLLIEMGFEAERSKLAVSKTKGRKQPSPKLPELHSPPLPTVQDAIEWLDKNQEKSLDEIRGSSSGEQAVGSSSSSGLDADGDQAETTGTAASLKCTDCGKLFSSPERAQFHATRTSVPSPRLSTATTNALLATTLTSKNRPKKSSL